jgi:hypothetical protein
MLSHQQNKLHYDGKVAEQAAYLDNKLHQKQNLFNVLNLYL